MTDNLRACVWRADDNAGAVIIHFQAREQEAAVCFRVTTSARILSYFWEMPSLRGAHWLSLAEFQDTHAYAIAVADHFFLDQPFIIGLELQTEGDPRDHIIAAEVWDKVGAEPRIAYMENSGPEVEVHIDLAGVRSEREVHELFASALHFPDFYGHNWDAFWDVLTGFDCFPPRLVLSGIDHLKATVPRAYEQLQSCFSLCQREYPGSSPEVIWQ